MTKTTNTKIDTKTIAKLIYERTQEWAKEEGVIKPEQAKFSSKAKKFDKIISNSNFGCQENSVRKLIEELIGEKLPACKQQGDFVKVKEGIALKFIKNSPSSSVDIDEPFLVEKKGSSSSIHVIQKDGKCVVDRLRSVDIRSATLEEVEFLLEELSKESQFFSFLLAYALSGVGV